MSLFKQLFIAICLLLLVNFTGSFLVGLESSREQQVNQLRSHAQDAATALGLSLTPHIRDLPMVELMVSSIFDSGYFESIRVLDPLTGEVLVESTGIPVQSKAPRWFAELVRLQPAVADAIISDGWRQAARVEVVSHPLFAIDKLWQSALGSLLWLSLCGVLSLCLGVLLLKRQLRPLDYMVAQSAAIARREFLSLAELPKTPEFRRVVEAMNQMVDKLKALFSEEAARSEQLRAEAYQDSLTGLVNRRYFDLQLHARLHEEEHACSGLLLLLRINDLAGLNQRLGGPRTDQLIAEVAQLIRQQLPTADERGAVLARNRGGEFALLVPGLDQEDAEQLAERLLGALASLQATTDAGGEALACLGLTLFQPGDSAAQLVRLADEALLRAAGQKYPLWAWASADGQAQESAPDERQQWYQRLDEALRSQRLCLYRQPVVSAADGRTVLHQKVLARLLDADGSPIAAGRFLPWLERFGWMARLDQLMLSLLLPQLGHFPQPVALSLSATSLREPQALSQLLALLGQHAHLADRLTLELDAAQLPEQALLEQFTRQVRGFGYRLAVQHFGGRFSQIGNLARLGLAYLKIEGSYLRAIDQEDDKRLFIEAIQRAANSIDLPLIGERVESEGEWQVLRALGITGVQGRLFGEPGPWA